jgi:hypothetical protein
MQKEKDVTKTIYTLHCVLCILYCESEQSRFDQIFTYSLRLLCLVHVWSRDGMRKEMTFGNPRKCTHA